MMNSTSRYNHASFERRRRILRFLMREIGFRFLAKIDSVEGIENIPAEGAAILCMNHIAFIDSLIVLTLSPRSVVPLAKVEVFKYPVVGIFPHIWGVVPVRREEIDRRAVQQALEVLKAGEIVLLAPEATRGPSLKRGREGVAYFASRTGAPIVPVAIDGSQGFPTSPFSTRMSQPGAHVRFGPPFRFRPDLKRPKGDVLRKMTDEAMYILAAMLPEQRRGVYADLSKATYDTIER
jgi:1-acyl-sn-glycerol-3-phosphate acyltransferase